LKRVYRENTYQIEGIGSFTLFKSYDYFKEYLDRIENQFCAMLSYHSRIFTLRLDLHIHDYTDDNQLMSKLIKKIKKHLKAKYNISRVGFIWAREFNEGKASAQHYHLGLILDEHKIQHPHSLIKWIEERWENWDLPKPYTPKNCYSKVHRGNAHEFITAFKRFSYLAKIATKGNKDINTKEFGSSRIRIKPCMV